MPILPAAFLLIAIQSQSPPGQTATPNVAEMPRAGLTAAPLALFLTGCDGDGDAVLTRPELDACAPASLEPYLDRDGMAAGYLSFADWAERHLGDRNALPSPFEIDRDGDNRITTAEFSATMAAAFERLDRDKDGRLTRAELLSVPAMGRMGPMGEPGQRRPRRR